MRKLSKWILAVSGAGVVVFMAALGSQTTLAQGGFGGRPSVNAQAFNACTTTNYADIISKTLNISTATLRKDIVGGQSLQDIATAANVDLQLVSTAYQTTRKADIDQAVKDGVLTQDEATAMEATPGAQGQGGARPTPNGTPGAQGQGNGPRGGNGGPGAGGPGGFQALAQFPDISTIRFMLQTPATQQAPGGQVQGGGPRGGGFGGPGGVGAGTFNLVKQYVVAAQALNMSCADLVKTLITPPGKTITAVAADQKVDPQVVSDALTKAYKDALAQDVTDDVITQAQSDQLSPAVDKAVSTFVSNPYVMGRQGAPATPAQ